MEQYFEYMTKMIQIYIYTVRLFKKRSACIYSPLIEKITSRKGRFQINHNTEHPTNYRLICTDTLKQYSNI